jgi:hypothetical protein
MGKTFPAISFQKLHSDIGCKMPGIVFWKGSSVNEQPRVFHPDSFLHMQQQCAVVVGIQCFRFLLANGTSQNSLYLQKLLRIYLLRADIFQWFTYPKTLLYVCTCQRLHPHRLLKISLLWVDIFEKIISPETCNSRYRLHWQFKVQLLLFTICTCA